MKIINNSNVTHIVVNIETEGIWLDYYGWIKMKYLPYRKHKWWETDKETLEGYYEDGFNGGFNAYRSIEKVNNNLKEWFVKDESLWTYPHIDIYVGKDLIHTEYFKTYKELEQHVKENYNHCKIKYQD